MKLRLRTACALSAHRSKAAILIRPWLIAILAIRTGNETYGQLQNHVTDTLVRLSQTISTADTRSC
ncbi:hypothetical protein BCEN4_420007 [Burkholderia cenocepacia]|nr:hypothetical protein BCEN4_420007 [Burkholderia cenocepacia]